MTPLWACREVRVPVSPEHGNGEVRLRAQIAQGGLAQLAAQRQLRVTAEPREFRLLRLADRLRDLDLRHPR